MEYTEGVRFDSLNLSPETMRAITERGLETTTPVQAGCIPPMMAWQDVIAKAPTGTGKTFAYGIPIIEHIEREDDSFHARTEAAYREMIARDPARFIVVDATKAPEEVGRETARQVLARLMEAEA